QPGASIKRVSGPVRRGAESTETSPLPVRALYNSPGGAEGNASQYAQDAGKILANICHINGRKSMSDASDVQASSRRDFFGAGLASAGAAALFGGMGVNPALAAEMAKETGRSEKPLKAAFSNAGLQATWCAQGKRAAEYWGKLFNVDVTWFDGELSAPKQRAAIDDMAQQKWDFVAIQAFGIGTLTAPVKKMIDA